MVPGYRVPPFYPVARQEAQMVIRARCDRVRNALFANKTGLPTSNCF